eukprot:361377-Chlamydomonas_euryale.AAC.2
MQRASGRTGGWMAGWVGGWAGGLMGGGADDGHMTDRVDGWMHSWTELWADGHCKLWFIDTSGFEQSIGAFQAGIFSHPRQTVLMTIMTLAVLTGWPGPNDNDRRDVMDLSLLTLTASLTITLVMHPGGDLAAVALATQAAGMSPTLVTVPALFTSHSAPAP